LVIPARSDVQIVGDGIENATKISLAGGAGPLLTINGPSRATIRNLDLIAGKDAVAILIKDCDQPGSRIFGEQWQTNGHEYGLVASGLKQAAIFLHDHGHNGLQVIGNGSDSNPLLALFCGASSRHTHHAPGIHLYDVQKGGRLLVRDIWYEGHAWSLLRLRDQGEFTYHCGFVAPYPAFDKNFANIPWEAELRQQVAPLEFDGFRGRVAFSLVSTNGGALRVKPPSAELSLLLLGYVSNADNDDLGGEALQGRVALAHFRFHRSRIDNLGSDAKPGVGELEPGWTLDMLKTLRQTKPCNLEAVPEGATDLRFFRVMASGREAVRIE
ncbi:MAG: hypothetical protein N3A66_07775, partial [Planctomycetota bacterium]|nr:hypothetical protein [Planctomycetota bacterium]